MPVANAIAPKKLTRNALSKPALHLRGPMADLKEASSNRIR